MENMSRYLELKKTKDEIKRTSRYYHLWHSSMNMSFNPKGCLMSPRLGPWDTRQQFIMAGRKGSKKEEQEAPVELLVSLFGPLSQK